MPSSAAAWRPPSALLSSSGLWSPRGAGGAGASRAGAAGRGFLTAVQLSVRFPDRLERGLPFGFQAAGDQPVFRVDCAVAAFSPGRGVAGLLGLAAPLLQRGVVPGLVRGIERGLERE